MAVFRTFAGLAIGAALWLGLVPGAELAEVGVARAAELASETRELPPFNRIETRGSFILQVNVGAEQSVRIETAERDLERVETEVRGETLILSYRERWFSFLFGSERIVTISLPALRGVELAGAGEINVAGIDSEEFDLTVSGAADVTLRGNCGALDFNLNGASDVAARELQCKSVDIMINGVGSAEIYASEEVSALLNGLGEIKVYGNPEKVSKQINGLGDFEIAE